MSQIAYAARPARPRTDAEPGAVAAGTPPTIHRRILEAMIPPGRAGPELREALLEVGYDPDLADSEAVAREVYCAVVDVLGHHVLPMGSHRERQRLMGRRLVQGFAGQPAGRVVYGGLRNLGPDRAVSRLPGSLRFGVTGMSIQVEPLGLRKWRVRLSGSSSAMGEFFCGSLVEMLAQVGAPDARATIESQSGGSTSVLLSWEDLGPKPFVDAE